MSAPFCDTEWDTKPLFDNDEVTVNSRNEVNSRNSHKYMPGRVVVPSFEVFSNPTVKIDDVKQRRFTLMLRSALGLGGGDV